METLADVAPQTECELDCGCKVTVRGRPEKNPKMVMVYIQEPCQGHTEGSLPPRYSVRTKGMIRQFKETQGVRYNPMVTMLKRSFGVKP